VEIPPWRIDSQPHRRIVLKRFPTIPIPHNAHSTVRLADLLRPSIRRAPFGGDASANLLRNTAAAPARGATGPKRTVVPTPDAPSPYVQPAAALSSSAPFLPENRAGRAGSRGLLASGLNGSACRREEGREHSLIGRNGIIFRSTARAGKVPAGQKTSGKCDGDRLSIGHP
jgi:hypothetical protein